jgi:hypothetical protein
MTIIEEVVNDMLKTDSTVSRLEETITHDIRDSINTQVEIQVKKRVEKSLEEARTKAALQAELEMVGLVLTLCDCITADLRPGKEALCHQSCYRQEPGGPSRTALPPVRGL